MTSKKLRIAIASDHAGFDLKQKILSGHLLSKINANETTLEWIDHGTHSTDRVDYPDYATGACYQVLENDPAQKADLAILICGSGMGMAITANKFPGIRAALCESVESARLSREHNHTNVLCLGSRLISETLAADIIQTWIQTPFSTDERHEQRLNKIDDLELTLSQHDLSLLTFDPALEKAIQNEHVREQEGIELIASENYVSRTVLEAQGSILTNKYAEGYPGKRYYGGCEYVDQVESLAIDRVCQLFGAEAANVQPHSGSQANMAAYLSVLKPGDKIMGMSLAQGGHLTHGSPVNFSGRLFQVVSYGLDPQTHRLNYDLIRESALKERPQLIIAGASAYPRMIDFKIMSEIAKEVEASFIVDMAHIAGLVATGLHPSPIPYADYTTSTTHKTLRGPRGGLILCKQDRLKAVNSQIFPGIQGGPLMHVIAAKAASFHEALQPSFKIYQQNVIQNAAMLAQELMSKGFKLVTDGTDNHLMLVDLRTYQDGSITGKDAETWLDLAGITVNKNAIPGDTRSPFITSGIRIGTPAITSRGMGTSEMKQLAVWMDQVLSSRGHPETCQKIRQTIKELAKNFPIPSDQF